MQRVDVGQSWCLFKQELRLNFNQESGHELKKVWVKVNQILLFSVKVSLHISRFFLSKLFNCWNTWSDNMFIDKLLQERWVSSVRGTELEQLTQVVLEFLKNSLLSSWLNSEHSLTELALNEVSHGLLGSWVLEDHRDKNLKIWAGNQVNKGVLSVLGHE